MRGERPYNFPVETPLRRCTLQSTVAQESQNCDTHQRHLPRGCMLPALSLLNPVFPGTIPRAIREVEANLSGHPPAHRYSATFGMFRFHHPKASVRSENDFSARQATTVAFDAR